MKIVCSDPKSGRSVSVEVPADRTAMMLNTKIGEVIDGTALGLPGYKMKITGGSDKSGFPMRKGIDGTRKAGALVRASMSGKASGQYRRMSSRGNTVSADIEQVNAVVVEYGDKSPDEVFPKKAPGAKKEEAAPEAAKK